MVSEDTTIVAVSTPPGTGGIAVIRMSGSESRQILSKAWKGNNPMSFKTHTAHLGWLTDSHGNDIDQAVVTYFKAPYSYTGEDVLEISCHGSRWIQQTIVYRLIELGATAAKGGDFTRRAFINGRIDLAQAEGVADMIAASSRASATLAASRLRGDYSSRLENLRRQLVDIGVLLELELDFSEEDVEFANRSKLISLAKEILEVVVKLAGSFKAGNAFKNGIPVAIAGVPNAGKSTLMNALIGEEKAIVSDIPGTTRDVIEDTVELSGILFRFFDTAGLRDSEDKIEGLGIEKAQNKIKDASILLFLLDPTQDLATQLTVLNRIKRKLLVTVTSTPKIILISTKSDITDSESDDKCVAISAKTNVGLETLKSRLVEACTEDYNPEQELIVTNARHYEALKNAEDPLKRLIEGLESGISADFLAQDLREADRYLGEITGAVSSSEILHTIFARYCIGK